MKKHKCKMQNAKLKLQNKKDEAGPSILNFAFNIFALYILHFAFFTLHFAFERSSS